MLLAVVEISCERVQRSGHEMLLLGWAQTVSYFIKLFTYGAFICGIPIDCNSALLGCVARDKLFFIGAIRLKNLLCMPEPYLTQLIGKLCMLFCGGYPIPVVNKFQD
jgi:hypothetical protein